MEHEKTLINKVDGLYSHTRANNTRTILAVLAKIGVVAGLAVYAVNYKTEELKPQIHTANVLGAEAPEKFYDIDGQRVYLQIDGQPVEQYLKERQ
ncbi:MAG: hypothetical protein QME12_01410 [Nanoarchaeota archaeon]|nr:hypothetical protein [Nanoarchaeota archaeon]